MERHDHHTVSQNAVPVKVPLTRSIRFRIALSFSLLLLLSIVTAVGFKQISSDAADATQQAVSLQLSLHQQIFGVDTLVNQLQYYLNTRSREDLQLYLDQASALAAFFSALPQEDFGPYSSSLSTMVAQLLAVCDQAIASIASNDTGQMLTLFNEASRIRDLISTFSAYALQEVELATADRLHAITVSTELKLRFALLLFCVSALLLALISIRIINSFLSPLRELIKCICSMSMNFDLHDFSQPLRNDEMGILILAFCEMVERIHDQVEELQKKQRLALELQQQKETAIQAEAMLAKSELRAYQSQINSHFLFNSLNTVSRLAYMENAPQVQRAINLIAQFLRDILTHFDRSVSLEEDFSIVSHYLEIQKLRFGTRISIESVLDVDVMWFQVPALTLQPMVENAFHHGLADSRQGYIRCCASQKDGAILLSVWDDGKGIPPERQAALLSSITQSTDVPGNGIGLRNIYLRLDAMYPGRVTPWVDSVPDSYTQIGFRIDAVPQASMGTDAS